MQPTFPSTFPSLSQPLAHPFPTLDSAEEREDWAREYHIALCFARERDFYRAITTWKRALFLLPLGREERLGEISYLILLSYYQAGRFQDVIDAFEKYSFEVSPGNFPLFYDLLTLLYDSFCQVGESKQGKKLIQWMEERGQNVDRWKLARAIQSADFSEIRQLAEGQLPGDQPLSWLESFERKKKSVRRAQWLNALLPGAGYLYVGQKKSGLTALLLNSLTTIATYKFFAAGRTAMGILLGSFEIGWYLGGIHGAGLHAKRYNEDLYQRRAVPILRDNRLSFPLQLQYHF